MEEVFTQDAPNPTEAHVRRHLKKKFDHGKFVSIKTSQMSHDDEFESFLGGPSAGAMVVDSTSHPSKFRFWDSYFDGLQFSYDNLKATKTLRR